MAQERSGNQKPGRGGRPSAGGSSSGAPRGRGGAGGSRPSGERGRARDGQAREGQARDGQGRRGADQRGGERRGDGRGPARSGPRDRGGRDERGPRTADQAVYDGPELPEDITGKELDRAVANQLKGLPEKLAARVARHLVAAGQLVDDDPETAYQHTLAARARAPRLAVVREAAGEAAYAAGHYAEALADLRAAKRMNGATDYLPIMADCHRALGQPEQAVKLAHSPSVANFASPAKAEMTIVEAGARRDMGQLDAALRVLEQAPLMSKSRESWVVRLRYAYADTLEAAGRPTEALMWFHRTDAIDADELTDAAARAVLLEKAQDQSGG
ncbi:MAG: tetratricopeptide repeat protein [Nocardioides sp.]|uniref:tetratricopeptide repeat protein n=1 Tax=Nocardioides sp. TaxID=35761 RepID=UPI00139E3EE7|nr:tetratricopeptide repeat protein [Nocardioides sp.]MSY86341.1 tetratricopeptide repeat protein [Actinomycetota bacterium]